VLAVVQYFYSNIPFEIISLLLVEDVNQNVNRCDFLIEILIKNILNHRLHLCFALEGNKLTKIDSTTNLFLFSHTVVPTYLNIIAELIFESFLR
jgi:hypothetical protein